MSFTYSGNPASSQLDEARFILGDTDCNSPIMQDEEIQYLIDTYGNNKNTLLYQLFTRATTLFARDIKRSLGPQSEDPTSRLNYYNSQAKYYKTLNGTSSLSQMRAAHPKVFRIGMFDNPPYPDTKGGNNV